jgi:hypothetical protein
MTFFRLDIDVSIMALNNAVNRGQSQAGTAVGDGELNIVTGSGAIMYLLFYIIGNILKNVFKNADIKASRRCILVGGFCYFSSLDR